MHVCSAYETSRLYRDLKLRGAVVKDRALIQLPLERVFSRVEGVWNLSSDQGNLGVFIVTNVRLVWHAALAENFNVSVPFIQMVRACAAAGGARGMSTGCWLRGMLLLLLLHHHHHHHHCFQPPPPPPPPCTCSAPCVSVTANSGVRW